MCFDLNIPFSNMQNSKPLEFDKHPYVQFMNINKSHKVKHILQLYRTNRTEF